jgi:hypothetical protein
MPRFNGQERKIVSAAPVDRGRKLLKHWAPHGAASKLHCLKTGIEHGEEARW